MLDIKHALLVVSVKQLRLEATVGRQEDLEERNAYCKLRASTLLCSMKLSNKFSLTVLYPEGRSIAVLLYKNASPLLKLMKRFLFRINEQYLPFVL